MKGTYRINGEDQTFEFNEKATLLEVLRDNGHHEVKNGCSRGNCGSCAVLLDGVLVNSCQVLAASVMGRDITTVKGIGSIHKPHQIQQAFADAGAVQCGFCTPGMILATYSLLSRNPDPSDEEIRQALDGNICRCTGYIKIFEAVRMAAKRMRDHE